MEHHVPEIREDFCNGCMSLPRNLATSGRKLIGNGITAGNFSLLMFKPAQFDELGKMAKADQVLIGRLTAVPIRELARKANVDRNTIKKILRRSAV
jgi:hypothetical protein